MKDLDSVSAHRLNMYLECPYKLAMYNFNVEPEPIDRRYIDTGNAVHEFLEDSYLGNAKEPEHYFSKWNVPLEMKDRFDACIRNCEAVKDWKGEPEVKKLFHVTLSNGAQLKIDARADLLRDDGMIVDWKTGKLGYDSHDIQGKLYLFAWEDAPAVIFHSLLTGEQEVVERGVKGYIDKLLCRYIEAVKKGDLPRKRGRHCLRCEYRRFCNDGDE